MHRTNVIAFREWKDFTSFLKVFPYSYQQLKNSWSFIVGKMNERISRSITRDETRAALDTAWFLSTMACFM